MLADSELGDRQLPDQCSGAPGQIQWSVTKCDVVGPSDGASPLCIMEPLIVADDYVCRPTAGRTSMPGMVVPSGVDI